MKQVKEILLQQMKTLEKKRDEMRCTDDLYYAGKINETAERYIKACEVEALSISKYIMRGTAPGHIKFYMCAPDKNTECKKKNCKYNPDSEFPFCDRTSNPSYAMRDENNQPIEAPQI